MAERLYPARILLEPDQHRRIREIARQEKRSISEVGRDLPEYALCQRAGGGIPVSASLCRP